ncbi:MAG: hypothetical protein ACFFD4_18720 [Candidatus Odinarchaeota archaeon]
MSSILRDPCRKLSVEHGYFAYHGSSLGQQGKRHVSLVFLETTENLLNGINAIETAIRYEIGK